MLYEVGILNWNSNTSHFGKPGVKKLLRHQPAVWSNSEDNFFYPFCLFAYADFLINSPAQAIQIFIHTAPPLQPLMYHNLLVRHCSQGATKYKISWKSVHRSRYLPIPKWSWKNVKIALSVRRCIPKSICYMYHLGYA